MTSLHIINNNYKYEPSYSDVSPTKYKLDPITDYLSNTGKKYYINIDPNVLSLGLKIIDKYFRTDDLPTLGKRYNTLFVIGSWRSTLIEEMTKCYITHQMSFLQSTQEASISKEFANIFKGETTYRFKYFILSHVVHHAIQTIAFKEPEKLQMFRNREAFFNMSPSLTFDSEGKIKLKLIPKASNKNNKKELQPYDIVDSSTEKVIAIDDSTLQFMMKVWEVVYITKHELQVNCENGPIKGVVLNSAAILANLEFDYEMKYILGSHNGSKVTIMEAIYRYITNVKEKERNRQDKRKPMIGEESSVDINPTASKKIKSFGGFHIEAEPSKGLEIISNPSSKTLKAFGEFNLEPEATSSSLTEAVDPNDELVQFLANLKSAPIHHNPHLTETIPTSNPIFNIPRSESISMEEKDLFLPQTSYPKILTLQLPMNRAPQLPPVQTILQSSTLPDA